MNHKICITLFFKLLLFQFVSYSQSILEDSHFKYNKFYEKDSVWIVENGRKVIYSIPSIKDTVKEKKLYCLGVNYGSESKFIYTGFKVYPKDMIKRNGDYIMPFMYCNVSDFSTTALIDVNTSQKRNYLLKRKLSNHKLDNQSDGENFAIFEAKKREWNQGLIFLPNDYDSTELVWVYFSLPNPKDRIVIYFPKQISDNQSKYFEYVPASYTLRLFDATKELDTVFLKGVDSLKTLFTNFYNLQNLKVTLVKDVNFDLVKENAHGSKTYQYNRTNYVITELKKLGINDIEIVDKEVKVSEERVVINLEWILTL